jgi:hypothetical protein
MTTRFAKAAAALLALLVFTKVSAQTNIFPSSGNVGIGTTSPGNKLQVISASAYDGIFASDGTRSLRLMPGTVGNASFNGLVRANDNAIIFSGGASGPGALTIAPWASATSGIRIDGSGNVGIGTFTPRGLLDVNGGLWAAGLRIDNGSYWGGLTPNSLVFSRANASYIYCTNSAGFLMFGSGGRVADFVIASNGNVGIGREWDDPTPV